MIEDYTHSKRKLIFKEKTKGTSLNKIKKFELENKISFPKDFKDFLLIYDGVSPERNRFIFRFSHNEEDNYFCLTDFMDLEYMEVFKNKEDYKDWRDESENDSIPYFFDNLVCIGMTEDAGHTEICLSLDDRNKGSIYLVYDGDPEMTILLANSFTEFINSFNPPFENEFEEVCELGDKDKAIELINSAFNLNIKSEYSSTTLSYALSKVKENPDFIDVVNLILNSDYKVLKEDLITSIFTNNLEIVKAVMKKIKGKLKGALATAAANDNLEILKFFYEKGYDINDINLYKQSSLICAVMSGKYESVRFLLENGADPNLKYSNGRNDELDNLNAIQWAETRIKQHGNYDGIENYKKCLEILQKK